MEKDLTSTNILNVDNFLEKLLKELESATKNAEDAARLLDRISSLSQLKCLIGDKTLLLINYILKPYGHELNLKSEYESTEDLCNAFDNIVDDLARRIDNHLQQAQGKKVVENEFIKENHEGQKKNKTDQLTASISTKKPQAFFKIKVDNSASPFVPLIFEKPNALKPLEESMRKDVMDDEMFGHPHPYQFELDNFKPNEDLMVRVVPKPPKDLNGTPLTIVETEECLDDVIKKLKNVPEIAVDLEHHSYRSYLGFTCLMQISTRDEDFIIDTLSLRHLMHKFNVVFTDPNIVKVLHGSDFDVIWLQKDFGVYLVNTFDTGLAARALKFSSYSYAYVLDHYCKVKADKQYQLADWRIRPLPEELVKYAREDTHYLLYIYDRMRNDLIKENNGFHGLMSTVIQNSTNLCKKRYEKPHLKENAHLDLLKTSNSTLNARQLEVLRRLYEWRDGMARELDESTGFILPNQKMLNIAKIMPKEIGGVIACLDQSKYGAAESIYRTITSVLCLPECYFDGTKEDKSKFSSVENNLAETNPSKNNMLFDMRGINKADYDQEDLIALQLKDISVREAPRKAMPTRNTTHKQQSSNWKIFHVVLSEMPNPLVTSWPDTFLAATNCTDDSSISYKMKAHTFFKPNSKLPDRPEVIETKPVMLLDETKDVDKLLKSVRTQIHEGEASKRKAEPEVEGSKKKKVKSEKKEVDVSKVESHVYDQREWEKMLQEPESAKKNSGKEFHNKKRKAEDPQHELKKKMKLPHSSRTTKSFSFLPKDNRNPPTAAKPLSNAPRIPWPSKK